MEENDNTEVDIPDEVFDKINELSSDIIFLIISELNLNIGWKYFYQLTFAEEKDLQPKQFATDFIR